MARSYSLSLALLALAACAEVSPPRRAADPEPSASPAAPDAGLTLASSAVPLAPHETEKRIYTVAAIGDSLTDARAHGGKFLEALKQRCPESRFDNYGKGGQMVNQMRRRFGADVLGEGGAEKPAYTHVIIFGGVNDLYSDETAFRTPAKIEADLSAMYSAAKQRGVKVVALTVAPWGGFRKWYNPSRARATEELNTWIRGRAGAGEVNHVIDAFALLSCGEPEVLCPAYMEPFKDGLHFGPKGHEKLAEALFADVFADCK
jgi:lysophospholipase L1-like esterase